MPVAEQFINSKLDKEISSLVKKIDLESGNKSSRQKITYTNFFSNRILITQVIKEGLPYSIFHLIQDSTPFSENDWANFLDISTKSLQRYKQTSKPFKRTQSEKILEMAEVTNVGLDVFGDMNTFKQWLDTPNFALGNIKPILLLTDSYGKELILAELTRINHGILA